VICKPIWLLVFCALAAPAARANPVVDISALLRLGLYQTSSIMAPEDTTREPEIGTACVTAASLQDFSNEPGERIRITSYRLDGNHLHARGQWISAGKAIGTVVEDLVFDNSTRMHATVTMLVHGKHPFSMRLKFASRRIGDLDSCTAGAAIRSGQGGHQPLNHAGCARKP